MDDLRLHYLKVEIKEFINPDGKKEFSADIKIEGNPTVISQSISGLLQADVSFREIVMNAILNAVAMNRPIQVEDYKINPAEEIKENG